MYTLRLNYYEASKISRVYVFIGDVPKSVKSEITKIESGKSPNSGILRNYFGSDYAHKLGLDLDKPKKGGTELPDAGPFQSDVELFYDHDHNHEYDGGDEDFSLDDIKNLVSEKPEVKEESRKNVKRLNYVYFSVYPDDKISELKVKIYEATGIHPFKQHLFMENPEGKKPETVQLGYNFYIDNIEKKIDSLAIYKQKDYIDTVPINTDIYENQENVRVDANERFEIMFNIYKSTNEISMICLDEFLVPSKLETYKKQSIINFGFVIIYFPMLTVLEDYLSSELFTKYPDFAPDTKWIYEEQKLMSDIEAIDKKDWRKIQDKLSISVVYSIIKVMTNYDFQKKNVNIRNLFDKLEMDKHIKYSICQMNVNGKFHIVEKTYKYQKSMQKLSVFRDYVLIKYYPDPEKVQHMRIVIYQNGNYEIRTMWQEEDQHQIEDIIKLSITEVNKIIEKINKMEVCNIPLESMTKTNSTLSEIDIVMSYAERVSTSNFEKIKKILSIYQSANWIRNKQEYEFNVFKGAYYHNISRLLKFYPVANSFEYMSDPAVKNKFNQLYEYTHKSRLTNRTNDVICEIVGIKLNESPFIFKYLTYLFYLFDEMQDSKVSQVEYNIRGLKEQDPILYNFKKIYDSSEVYSKICQKPFQPIILTQSEYDRMNKGEKSRVVKYWNFTKSIPAYYSCPNPKYPFIRFIVKKHPKGYCIPCCKKNKQPENAVTKACMTDHCYSAEVKNVIVSSRYITSYGRFIDIGRLSKLPESTMDVIFHGIYSSDRSGTDSGCSKSEGYYLYGVSQTLQNTGKIGVLHCLADAMNLKPMEIIGKLIKAIGPDFYYEYDNDFIKETLRILDTDAELPDIDFNDLLMNLSRQYLNINFIVFEDLDGNISLKLPKYMKTYRSFIPSNYKNIVILQKLQKVYPVYLINEDVYFKTGLIENKTFTLTDQAIRTIQQLVKKYIEEHQFDSNIYSVKNVIEFIEKNPSYNLKSAIISENDIIFGLEITTKNRNFYFPVEYILYSKEDFKVPGTRFNVFGSFSDVVDFVETYNKWLLKKNMAGITISKLLINSDSVIGFRNNNINHYFIPISRKSSEYKKYKSYFEGKPEINILYNIPTNMNILTKHSENSVTDEKTIAKAYYRVMLYPLIVNLVGKWLNRQRNEKTRTKIKIYLLNLNAKATPESLGISESDFLGIRQLVADFYKHKDRKLLIDRFNNRQYDFDKTWIAEFIESKKQKEMVTDLLNKIAVKSEKQPEKKYNVYDGTGDYGKSGKIFISPEKWDTIIELLLQDLNNPLKRYVLDKYMNNTVNYFNFTQRPNEHIHILQ